MAVIPATSSPISSCSCVPQMSISTRPKIPPHLQPIVDQILANSIISLELSSKSSKKPLCKKDLSAIAWALQQNHSVTMLNLGFNKVCPKGAQEITRAFQNKRFLTTLCLGNNEIGDEGAIAIASLLGNQSLKELYLGSNHIGPRGAKAIGKALQSNSSLLTLYLGNNPIGDEGATELAEALWYNRSLTTLSLTANGIGVKGVKSIASAVVNNQALKTLYLLANKIGEEGINAFVKTFTEALNQQIKHVLFDPNPILLEDSKSSRFIVIKENFFSLTTLSLDHVSSEIADLLAENARKRILNPSLISRLLQQLSLREIAPRMRIK